MNNTTFTTNQANALRTNCAIFGQLFGMAIIYPISDNLDLQYNEKVKKDAMRLATPIKKYMTKMVLVEKTQIGKNADGKAVVIINDDPDLTFPLNGEKPKIFECTPERVNEALLLYRTEKKITFFTDVENVAKTVISNNAQNANDLDAMAEELMLFANTLREINKTEEDSYKSYKKSIELV